MFPDSRRKVGIAVHDNRNLVFRTERKNDPVIFVCVDAGSARGQGCVVELDHPVVLLCGLHYRLVVQREFSVIRVSEDRDIWIF